MKKKLKILASVYDYKNSGLPSVCGKFNGKPAMVHSALKVHRCREMGYLELDIDMRPNNIIMNRVITSMIPGSLLKLTFALALIVQGEQEDELPERCLSAIKFINIDARNVPFWPFEQRN
mmetsp:Transcript_12390/g.14226  ORF Transcript_12390/g.14226 Transcript_12390/m.14226 type:complete len:120 (-) Transcript_12390:505-864(-)